MFARSTLRRKLSLVAASGLILSALAAAAMAQQPEPYRSRTGAAMNGGVGTGTLPTAERAYTMPYVVTVMMIVLGMTAACMPTIRSTEVAKNEEE